MSIDLTKSDRDALGADEAKALASQIMADAGPDEEFDVGVILERHPALAEHRSVVLDLVYEEFCRRLEAGEPADANEFARRFPDIAQSFLEVVEVHRYFEQHPNAVVKGPPRAWPKAGEQVAGFTLLREIGRGGFSRVFLAREKGLGDRHVVVKVCQQANEEAAWLGQLVHPHVVPVHSVRILPRRGLTVICMPYLGSATLADVIAEVFAANPRRRGSDVLKVIQRANQRLGLPGNEGSSDPAPPHWTLRRGSYAEAIVEIGAEICEALAYAHRKGVQHCDVKPSNVLLTNAGRSLLLDFNLSKQHGAASGVVGGTLPYMAPEQLQVLLSAGGKHVPQVDARTDLFAFGVTMFQSLTGKLPFAAGEPSEAKQATARRLIDQQRQAGNLRGVLERAVSRSVAGAISQCLAFDPNERPASAQDVARRLREDLRPIPRARRWVRSHRLTVAVAALALVLAANLLSVGLARRHFFYCRQGIEDFEAGDFQAAIGWFDWAVAARGDYWDAYVVRGAAKLQAAQARGLDASAQADLLHSAGEDLDRIRNETLRDDWKALLADCLTEMGKLYYQMGMDCFETEKFDAAIEYFDGAVHARARDPSARIMAGWSRLRAARREGLDETQQATLLRLAGEDFATTLKQTERAGQESDSPEALASLGYVLTLMQGRDYRDAIDWFEKAVRLGMSTPAVLNNLGYCLSLTNPVEAEKRLRQAVEQAPPLQAAYRNLAWVELLLAKEAVLKARRERNRKRAQDAAIYEGQAEEKSQAAIQHIESARRLGPRSAELEFAAARIHAFACTLSGDADTRQDRMESTLRSCQGAVELGWPPQMLKELAVMVPQLDNDSRFQKLCSGKVPLPHSSPANAAASASLLVDIYPDIRKRLRQSGR